MMDAMQAVIKPFCYIWAVVYLKGVDDDCWDDQVEDDL